MRIRCARPSASVASVLLRWADIAARTWRVSRHTTGTPSAFNSGCSQGDNDPASWPARFNVALNGASALAMASGSVGTEHCIRTAPWSSTTHTAVSSIDTSSPAKWAIAVILRRFGGRELAPAIDSLPSSSDGSVVAFRAGRRCVMPDYAGSPWVGRLRSPAPTCKRVRLLATPR